ncbi:MAG TPA: hypothetical protein VMS02_07485 [Solirubrobacteraceae bacterium]|nr:hypothetical protein [Solirubrobacteraceae bacterium]
MWTALQRALKRSARRWPPALLAPAAAGVVAVCAVWPAAAAGEADWRLAPAQAPPPPAGVPAAPYPVPVGTVGEISFWAPNRGVLITGGTEREGGPVPSGVYAYDGVSWHLLANVCGSAEGRIVWAGPDEFWTISDQRVGQQIEQPNGEVENPAVSLCHFVDGQVVGSYAMPLEEPDSWSHMNGGACYTPTDCWFGGADGRAPNVGAFHLHWNGSTVTAVYAPEDHAVTSVASFDGELYEGVQLAGEDLWLSEAERKHPAVIHTIAATGVEPFTDLTIFSTTAGHDLPLYGEKVLPEALQGFELAANAPAGGAATQLWAVAEPAGETPGASQPASFTVLRDAAGTWSQVLPGPHGEEALQSPRLAGSQTQVDKQREWGTAGAIAPEPGSEDAWLALQSGSPASARLALLSAAGDVVREVTLPVAGEDVGLRGHAGPIVCPAVHDCWLATEEGWLFHLSAGGGEAADDDPFFDGADGVITYRPPDAGTPVVYPDGFAEDDSLANQQVVPAPPPPVSQSPPANAAKSTTSGRRKPLLQHVQSRFRHHRTLVITFTLTARAHVQLIARRRHQVVATTRRETLHPGRHTLALTLDPRRWPTKLQFEAKPIGGAHGTLPVGTVGSGGAEGGADAGVNAVET